MNEKMRTLGCFVLTLALLLALAPAPARAAVPRYAFTDDTIDVTQYSYEILPILAPFGNFVYVRTENPDPTSFCFVDRDSKYTPTSGPSYQRRTVYTIFNVNDRIDLYADVVYEDASRYRVQGGYLFGSPYANPDGGELMLQKRVKDGYISQSYINWESNYVDTGVTVPCPAVMDETDALLESFTDPAKSLFENLDAVQAALDRYAIYPLNVVDENQPNPDLPYPFLTTSPYPELGINRHYDRMYGGGKLFLTAVYPYVLDSLGVPGVMEAAAKRLAPTCIVQSGSSHAQINVVWAGECRPYGGAGAGTPESLLFTGAVAQDFRFDGSAEDRVKNGTLDGYRDDLLQYAEIAVATIAPYRDAVAGETFQAAVSATGGTWVKANREGYSVNTGKCYAYYYDSSNPNYNQATNYSYLSNAWVDGRYVNKNEFFEPGATFAQYPTAAILVPKMHYTNRYGEEYTRDVVFYYNQSQGYWWAPTTYGTSANLPAEFILTREQVEAMQVDRNTDLYPMAWLIYDGTAEPGTPAGSTPQSLDRVADLDYVYDTTEAGELRQAVAYDAEGRIVLGGITWSISPQAEGITCDRRGQITVSDKAPGGLYTVTATGVSGVEGVASGTLYVPGTQVVEAYTAGEWVFVDLWNTNEAVTLYCAAYDEAGRLLALEAQSAGNGQQTYTFTATPAAHHRIFALDGTGMPLCPSGEVGIHS